MVTPFIFFLVFFLSFFISTEKIIFLPCENIFCIFPGNALQAGGLWYPTIVLCRLGNVLPQPVRAI